MDALGDRCRRFESAEAGRRAMPGIPLLARLDGRAFHTFTRGLNCPFDERFGRCMVDTARTLVDDLHAPVGYTQCDEITLLWWVPVIGPNDYPFDGRFQNLASISAGIASAAFARLADAHLPEKSRSLPSFDARVWQVPTKEDAIDVLTWREDDATKNSLSMAGRAHFSHAEIHGRGSSELHELLHARGVNWNDYPTRFKRGVYLRRETTLRGFTQEQLARIPERHRPPPGATVARSEVRVMEMPPIRRVTNVVETVFEGAAPRER
jgi:tRNA(His) 5'-end guanylyltransferase